MGWDELSGIVSVDTSKGTITNGTGFERAEGVPGFCTWTVSEPDDWTSEGLRNVVHVVGDVHVVPRAAPLRRITEAELPLPATKFTPWTESGKPSTAPAIALEGRIVSITGPLVRATVAEEDFVESAWLVAITETAFGDGGAPGAV